MIELKIWVFYALMISATFNLFGCQSSDRPQQSPSVIRGQALRKDIDVAYHNLVASGVPLRGANISETVSLHIPPGTSFEDAEAILKAAGFEVAPRPVKQDQFKLADHGHVVGASINPYIQHLISRDILFAQLISEKQYEFRAVQGVRVVFTELSL